MTKSRDLADNSQNTKPKVVDAKGDLIVGTGADAADRLAVGSNGYTLVADSSTSTGLAYAGTTNGNPVLNSAFQIWQRGTSFAGSTTAYTADRWQGYRGVAGSTFSRQVTGDTTNLPNIQYCMRVARDSGNTATNDLYLTQAFESVNSIPYAGKTVTVSFYMRKGANLSVNPVLAFYTGTGTDQNVLSGYTGSKTVLAQSIGGLTSTWQRYSYTATLDSNITEMQILFSYSPTGTAGANDYFEITGVQIDLGSTALPFRTYANTIQGELAACQRYYEKSYNPDVAPATNTAAGLINAMGTSNGGADVAYFISFKVNKRANPTFTFYKEGGASGSWEYQRSGVGTTGSAASAFSIGTTGGSVSVDVGANWTNAWIFGHWVAEAEL